MHSLYIGRHRGALRLVPLVLALAISQAYGVTVTGAAGSAGTNGATPGAAGTNGGNGGDVVATVVNGQGIDAWGGDGGAGGNGAGGVVNGAAGSGGNGGHAMSTTIVSNPAFVFDGVTAFGGYGGAAGLPGAFAGTPGAQGASGNGGDATLVYEATGSDEFGLDVRAGGGGYHGFKEGHHTAGNAGSAHAALTVNTARRAVIEANVHGGNSSGLWIPPAAATGGAGGSATLEIAATSAQVSLTGTVLGGIGNNAQGGAGTSGGNGATATARLAGRATESLTTRLTLEGGAGGAGTNGASGGHGGNTVLDMPFDTSATSGPIDVDISSVAGDGGATRNGLAGRAGSATTGLVLDARRAASVRVSLESSGGDGGSVFGAAGSLSPSFPAGGGAARTDLQVTTAGPVQLLARAWAGAAGSREVASGSINGIDGTNAATSIVAATDTTEYSNVVASAGGGAGGGTRGAGNVGGKGGTGVASVTATNAGSGNLSVQASGSGGVGGTGYEGARAGDGGDAVLVNAVSASTNGRLWLSQLASGGAGGATNGAGGSGGSAVSRLTLTDSRSTDLTAEVMASGGSASNRFGGMNRAGTGNAEAVLVLESARAATPVKGSSTASIAAGDYWGRDNRAVARSTVIARGAAESTAQAYGSYGGHRDAFARAQSASAATATATATAGGDRYSGIARSRAEADSAGGAATANAVAIGANAQSVAVARGQGGMASARSDSAASMDVRGRASASATVQGETVARADSNANGVMHAVDQPALMNGAGSSLAVLPTAAVAAAALETAPGVAAAFGNRKLLGVGGMESANANAGTYTYVASAGYDMVYHYRSLQLGLFDAAATGNGLQSLSFTLSDYGTQVFSRSFASTAEALAFFDDNVFQLPTLPDSGHDGHQLLLSTSFTYSGPGAFSFGYVLGVSAVPEPQTWLMLLGGLAVAMVAGRRRRA